MKLGAMGYAGCLVVESWAGSYQLLGDTLGDLTQHALVAGGP